MPRVWLEENLKKVVNISKEPHDRMKMVELTDLELKIFESIRSEFDRLQELLQRYLSQ